MNSKSLKKVFTAILPGLIVAGLIFGANVYYDLDLGRVIVEQITRIVGMFETTATTTLATVSGYVGIATSTPTEALTVSGNVLSTGNLTISGGKIFGANQEELWIGFNNDLIQVVRGPTPTTYIVCDSSGNCAGNYNYVGGTGTPNYLAKFSATSTLTTSTITEIGGVVNIPGTTTLATTAGFVGIATSTPYSTEKLTVYGNIWGSGNIILQKGSYNITLTPATLTANRTITFPDLSGTVAVSSTAPITLSSTGVIGLTTPLAISFGGTATSSIGSAGSVVYSNGTTYAFTSVGIAGQPLLSGGSGAPTWGTLSVSFGGTGLTSVASGALLYGSGGTTLNTLAIGSAGYILASNGSAPYWASLSSLSIATGTGAANYIAKWTGTNTLSTSTITDTGTLVNIPGTTTLATTAGFVGIATSTPYGTEKLTVYGNIWGSGNIILQKGSYNITLTPATLTANRTITFPDLSGTVAVSSTAPITLSSTGVIGLTTPLAISFGGTATSSIGSAGSVVYSNGTTYAFTSVGIAGQPLLSGGSGAPTWGTLSVSFGGTGLTSVASGALLYGSGGTTLNTLAIGSAGYILASNGSAPYWASLSSLSIATGTGAANYIAKWTGTNTLSTSTITDDGSLVLVSNQFRTTATTTLATSGGYVGIGTTAPAYTLDVNGTLRVSATSTFSARVGIRTTAPSAALEIVGESVSSGNAPLALKIVGGNGGSGLIGGQGGGISITGGTGGSGTSSIGGAGGDITLTGGTANSGPDGSGNPGNVILQGGQDASGVYSGYVIINAQGGNVGIGTTAPSYTLDVSGTLRATATTTLATAGGNVGIGTTGPTAKLHVLSTTEQLRLGYDASNAVKFTVGSTNALTITPLVNNTSGFNFTNAAGTSILNIDTTNQRVGIGMMAPAQKLTVAGNVGLQAGANAFIGTLDNYALSLRTNNTDRVFITNAGNVGIGTTTPGTILTIGTGQISVPLGSAAAPSYSFSGDLNTGIFSPGADTLAFSTGGLERMRIDSSGNVGIKTSPEPGITLDVKGTLQLRRITDTLAPGGTTNSNILTLQGAYYDSTEGSTLTVWWDIQNIVMSTTPTYRLSFKDTSGNERLVILDNGNVGIGTTGPTAKLHVLSTTEQLRLGYDASNAVKFTVGSTNALTITPLVNNTSGFNFTNAAGTSILNIDTTNQRVGIGMMAPAQKLTVAGNVGLQAGANAFIGTLDNYALSLRTNNTDRVFITNAGNVGIGTTTPGTILTIGTGQISVPLGSAAAPSYSFSGDLNTGIFSPGADTLAFSTGGLERMRIDSSGNVGIKTSPEPGITLDVKGTLQLRRITDTLAPGGTTNSNILTLQGAYYDSTEGSTLTVWWDIQNIVMSTTPTYRLSFKDTSGNERLVILDNGNVGIGTTGPTAKLHVLSTTEQLRLGYDASNAVKFTVGSTNALTITPLVNNTSGFNFTNAAGTSILNIDTTNQRVGIKNTAPAYDLDVTGSVRITANLGVSTVPGANYRIYAYRPSGDYGADKTSVYGYRYGSATSSNGGASWVEGGVDAAVKGASFYGNQYTAGVAGYNFNDYALSAGVIGAQWNATYWAALAFKDADNVTWGVYTPNNAYFGGPVGIGTTGPSATLQVAGNVKLNLPGAGTGYALCHTTQSGTTSEEIVDCTSAPSADYAEMYPVEEGIEPGDLVAPSSFIVETTDGKKLTKLTKTTQPYQSTMIGVVSDPKDITDFNVIGFNIKDKDNPMPVALSGRVLVKVSTENGEIKPGDLLTSASSTPGVAMKATEPGRVIGIALEGYNGERIGKITVFVNPHFWLGPIFEESTTTEQLGIFDKFTLAIKRTLEKLGLIIENGIAQIKEIITEKLSAKVVVTNQLCLGQTCIDEAKLKELLEKTGTMGTTNNQTTNNGTTNNGTTSNGTTSNETVSNQPANNETTNNETTNNGQSGSEQSSSEQLNSEQSSNEQLNSEQSGNVQSEPSTTTAR